MSYRIARAFLVSILTAALVISPPPAFACGPFFPVTIFIQGKHPDLPLAKYAAGNLGVVQPSYARSYLVVAYRYFSGGTFTAAEQKQLVGLWAHRLDREEDWVGKSESDAASKWLEARSEIGAEGNPSYVKKDGRSLPNWSEAGSRMFEYDNCSEDAFQTAMQTLRVRAKKFGPGSEVVRNWIEAQDTVFSNCGGGNPVTKKPFLPRDPEENLPPAVRADREYQMAAAYFYGGDWKEAERRFLQISNDAASPWKNIAAIVAVRSKIRAAMLSEDDPKTEKEELAGAEARLLKLEGDPALREMRRAIWRMRGYVEFRLTPEKRLLELARAIETDTHRKNLRQDLDDYTQLLDREIGDSPTNDMDYVPPSKIPGLFERTAKIRRQSPMTDWILTFQGAGEGAAAHARAKWKETHANAWLIATLSKADGNTPELTELLDAAEKIAANSNAYLTAAFQRSRLLAETDKQEEARQIAEALLARGSESGPVSARNLFLALRMKLARKLDEFLEYAPREASLITTTDDDRQVMADLHWESYGNSDRQAIEKGRNIPRSLFDADSSRLLTQGLPTSVLTEAAKSERLPEALRRQVAQAAWVRAVMLDDERNARALVPVVSALSPDLSAMLKSYDGEESRDARRFAAVYLILHRPELRPYVSSGVGRETPAGRIDSYRDNWWCSFGEEAANTYEQNYYTMFSDSAGALAGLYASTESHFPAFLKEEEKKLAEKEWESLAKLEGAPDWLGAQTLVYAKEHPEDPRVPEALHLVVRATRYGCSYDDKGRISKAAFLLLHRKYAKSEWTKRTPYWY